MNFRRQTIIQLEIKKNKKKKVINIKAQNQEGLVEHYEASLIVQG